MQIYPDGIRHIRADKRVNEWRSPGKRTIVKCAVNERQVVIALSGGEIVYFEMDLVSVFKQFIIISNLFRLYYNIIYTSLEHAYMQFICDICTSILSI